MTATTASDADRAGTILDRLDDAHPEAVVELDHEGPLQLLIATILSAQSTDKRVNQVTPELFRRYPDAGAFADADREELHEAIRSTGFFRQKAKHIQGCCEKIVREHEGRVPDDMEALTDLPGVGRKTASVILAGAYDEPAIAVDTHCKRVSNRLGLVASDDPVKIEHRLRELVPEDRWAEVSRLFIWHGRYVCKARKPRCEDCVLPDLCPWYQDHRD